MDAIQPGPGGPRRTVRPWGAILLEAVFVLAVLLATLKAGYGIERAREPDLHDEGHYMAAGVRAPERGLPWAGGSPLYCVWHLAVSWLEPEPLEAQALSWKLLITGLCLAVYGAARAAGAGRGSAAAAVGVLLCCGVSDTYPYGIFLACGLLLAGAAAFTRLRGAAPRLAALGVALLAASYVRPEYFLAYALVAGTLAARAAWRLWRRRDWAPTSCAALAAATGVGLALLGYPLGERPRDTSNESIDLNRSVNAFAQHYSVNLWQAAGKAPSSEPWTNWQQPFERDFGNCRSMTQVVIANPAAFAWHVGYNLRRLPVNLAVLVGPSKALHPSRRATAWALVGAVLAAGAVGLMLRRGPSGLHWRRTLAVLAVVAVPTAATCVVVAPRLHYLTPLVVLTLVLAAAGVGEVVARATAAEGGWLRPVPAALVPAAAALALLLAVPNHAGLTTGEVAAGRGRPAAAAAGTRAVVLLIRGLTGEGPVRYLDWTPAYGILAGRRPCSFALCHHKTKPFWDFVREAGINLMVLDPVLTAHTNYANDPDFQEFFAGLRTEEFELFTLPGSRVRVARKRGVWPTPPPAGAIACTGTHGLDAVAEASGGWSDGWLGRRAELTLLRPGGKRFLRLRVEVPHLGDSDFRTGYRLNIDGRQSAAGAAGPGEMEMLLPVAGDARRVRLSAEFDAEQPLPGGEARSVAARLVSAEWLGAPPPVAPDRPGHGIAGAYAAEGLSADGWLSRDIKLQLVRPAGKRHLRVRAMVPNVAGAAFRTGYKLSIDGRPVAAGKAGVGDLEIAAPLPDLAEGEVPVMALGLVFDADQALPGESRRVTARLSGVEWDDALPPPPPPPLPQFPNVAECGGVSPDGWLTRSANLTLRRQPGKRHLRLTVMVPHVSDAAFRTGYKATTGGRELAAGSSGPGDIDMTLALPETADTRLNLVFDIDQGLPGESRRVGGLLKRVDWVDAPAPAPAPPPAAAPVVPVPAPPPPPPQAPVLPQFPGVAAYEGLSSDGWLAKRATLTLQKRQGKRHIRLSATVPQIADAVFKTRYKVTSGGHELAQGASGPGEIDLLFPLPETADARLEVVFDADQALPGDGRRVAALLKRAEWADAPEPVQPARPPAPTPPAAHPALGAVTEVVGVSDDGWAARRAGLTLARPQGARQLRVRALVPTVLSPDFRTRYRLTVDGREAAAGETGPGELDLRVTLPEGAATSTRTEVEFERSQRLPGGDGREVGARLLGVEWVK